MERAERVSSGKDWIACRGCSAGCPPNCPGFILGATGLTTSSSSFHGTTRSISARNRSLRVVLLFDAQFSLSECSLCHATDSISFWLQQHLPKRRERAVSNKTSRKRGFAAFPQETLEFSGGLVTGAYLRATAQLLIVENERNELFLTRCQEFIRESDIVRPTPPTA